MNKKNNSNQKPLYVIGIGASAGGLDAINLFFENTPDNTGCSYVIVQHLSPDHKSLMADLLKKHTAMIVVEAENGMTLNPNWVYLLPSKKLIEVKGNKLHLYEKEKSTLPNVAIDIFFESLAKEFGTKAIGVVLSGTGSDGTKGLQAILDNGGYTIVQDPSTAAFNGMPNSAISSGAATMIGSPEVMAADIMEYIKDHYHTQSLYHQLRNNETILNKIISVVRPTGYDFSNYKSPTLLRRLSKRMSELRISSLESYLEYLNTHPSEIKVIAQEFLINVTQFFRDKEAFDTLKDKVIPQLLDDKKPGDLIKIWVVACSTGEEAYSLAMLFREYMEQKKAFDITVKIFATDVDKEALEVASSGIYSRNILQNISGQRIAKYFDIENDSYRVKPELRKMVLFSAHDVIKDPPFGKIDLISCRNFMIYINQETQKEILRKFHFALNLNGYLFVGPSEHVDSIKSSLEEIDKKWRIFKCINKARFYDQTFFSLNKSSLVSSVKVKNPMNHMGDLLKETLEEDDRHAALLVDTNFDVKQAIGNYKKYLSFPERGFNFNLLKMVNSDLSITLGSALRKAIKDHKRVVLRNVKLGVGTENLSVSIIVKPYLTNNEYHQQFLFVYITTEEVNLIHENSAKNLSLDTDVSRVHELEAEVRETRENLQAVIEEMEATNEELQSANEELVSTNEEMQSANEELQSLNEELHTVSTEHQAKIKELMELNDDLNNYFKNSEIGQLLIDRNFVIRKFSPSVTKMVNLVASDINRSIVDITTRFKDVDFIGYIGKVMSSGVPVESEVIVNNAIYIMKISPYEKHNNTTDGVIVNFIDITTVKRLDGIINAVFKSVPSAILAAQAVRNTKKQIIDFVFIECNDAAEKEINLPKTEIIGKNLKTVFPSKFEEMLKNYAEVVETGKPFNKDCFNEQSQIWRNQVLVKMMDSVVSVSTDITETRKTADLVQKNYEELRKSLKFGKRVN